MAPPTVAIVVTNYNYGRFLAAAIDSALQQTRPAQHVIVVDDGSNDDSLAILDEYPSRVRTVLQENAGVIAARNV